MRNKIKINDWMALQTLFDVLNKRLEKVMRAQGGGAIPGFYFRALAVLDAAIEQTFANKAGIKKMSSTNAKAFNSIRQRLKKHFRDDAAMAAGLARARRGVPGAASRIIAHNHFHFRLRSFEYAIPCVANAPTASAASVAIRSKYENSSSSVSKLRDGCSRV